MSNAVAVADANGALMSFIERASRDESFDVGKFSELLRLQREVAHDQQRRAFNAAMAEAQAEMLPVARDAKNSHLNNKYATLEAIDSGIRPIYTKHGFSVRYGSAPAPRAGDMRITCTVAHAAGYYEENYLDSPLAGTGAQGGRTATTPVQSVGATITYLRRYLLGMCFNIVLADDDDGESQRNAPTTKPPPQRKPPPPPPPVSEDPLDEKNGFQWLKNLEAALAAAQSQQEVVDIGAHPSVGANTANAPPDAQRRISELLATHYARFLPLAEPTEEDTTDEPPTPDPPGV